MDTIRPRSAKTVRKLARQLSRRAALGLGVFAAIGLMCALVCAIGVYLLIFGERAMSLGEMLLHLSITFFLGWSTFRIYTWLVIPAPRPEGVRLDRDKAPSLHMLVDNLARRMSAPMVDRIRITADMNAAVHQRPVKGLWGRMETTLVLGLPLVHSISPRQLTAILAHEMAHLVRQRHGSLAWDAHLRAWWHRVCERIASDGSASARLLTWLLTPWAEAGIMKALELNHLEEYEADRVASRVVTAKLLGDTLVEVAMKSEFIEGDYWEKVMAQAEHSPRPTIRPFRDMGMGVAAGFQALPQNGLLRSLISDESGGIMHPTLTDRLVALRVAPRVPIRKTKRSAASHYLRPALPGLSKRFDGMWWRATRPAWREYYKACQIGQDD
ncbi:M48 family metallopeptidase [Nitrogeniibacter aestuarii]|uniref:M48 family metallopeptidase n=1 Tax=Nitrogeniibacter aestuarii TaxID=2815343 RepID=UPI001D10230B|nr:M48 family metallopeptidase [Nitrogeniibacter aestuarii]